ncbi:MAG: putative O-glycosylation ligase, exosortase A system-associated, partial [Candidatus Poribacteria bacterium]|nr:putative O-glycosylation ligase, exosortase A system-associated [Candidatus Poribacteria bacterium]
VGYRSSHSIYFEVLGEHGFVGLALYLALGIGAFLTGTRVLRYTRGQPDLSWARDLASMLQVTLITFAMAGTFLGLAFFDLYYHLVAIMILVGAVVKKALSTVARESGRQRILDHAAQSSLG